MAYIKDDDIDSDFLEFFESLISFDLFVKLNPKGTYNEIYYCEEENDYKSKYVYTGQNKIKQSRQEILLFFYQTNLLKLELNYFKKL